MRAGYRTRFGQLLEEAVSLAGGRSSHVFVLSTPDYSLLLPAGLILQKAGVSWAASTILTNRSPLLRVFRALIASDSVYFTGVETPNG